MDKQHNFLIDGNRLWKSIMDLAKIGATEKGGNCRLALTDLDKEARDLFIHWCKKANCTISIDQMGNIFARRPGTDPLAASVMTGSHLDTQPTGGRFDGVYGVLAGLEVIRTLNDLGTQTERPIDVVVWTNEEGSRFAPSMISSAVFSGSIKLEDALAQSDPEGLTIGDELERIGYAGKDKVGSREIHAYFEAHIEQGPILEAENKTIGIVTGAQGQRWYEVKLTGVESHAGPTPMDRRKDALLGAARLIELVNHIGLKYSPHACATVGMINSYPNSRNVIPGRVFLTIDFRHPDNTVLTQMDTEMRNGLKEIAYKTDLKDEINQILYLPPIIFNEKCISAVRQSTNSQGYTAQEIVSGAGHDACNIASVTNSSMIFIPCIDGISHNEVEDAKPEWITAGGQVLLGAVLEMAGVC
jgi:N-carbamoyl-L-amino-acid hydrolase